ncbi:MAG TPA: phenylalanine--tRNA ligase subunit beta [bacterium]|nr:phenylalanine--tRNA ligase subunit beta [bacterium]
MLISLNILKKFVDLPEELSALEIANLLTMKTMEVEGVEKLGEYWEKIVIGQIISVENHPQADRLRVCQVDVGKGDLLNIVCGGINLSPDMLVAVAPVGAKVLWHGTEEAVLEKTKIRGVESEGMICAASGIALGNLFPSGDEREILDLTALAWEKGKAIKDYLSNDTLIEVDNKSINHRPDLWGHYGIARELSAILHQSLKFYSAFCDMELGVNTKDEERLTIDSNFCDHYLAMKIKNVSDVQSPLWLKQALSDLGMKSISALVDIGNYVMAECGQPLHVFDASTVENEKITVRAATEDEKFIGLDGGEYILHHGEIVIADEEKILALAGILGGADSAFNHKTKEVILEAAHFPADKIRKASMNLSLRTDASMRYEKSLDPVNVLWGVRRFWQLVKEIFPAAEVEWINRFSSYDESIKEIKVAVSEFARVSGVDLSRNEIENILTSLGFVVAAQDKKHKDLLTVSVPTWRATKDINLPIDLVEEVLRIYGYDNIALRYPQAQLNPPVALPFLDLRNKILDHLVLHHNLFEVYNYSFLKLDSIKKLGIDNLSKYIYLLNPVDKTRPVLRDDLIYNLLENLSENEKHQNKLGFFEIGRVFRKSEKDIYDLEPGSTERLPYQHQHLGVILADEEENLLHRLQSLSESLFQFLGKNYIIEECETAPNYFHSSQVRQIVAYDENQEKIILGHYGLLSPMIRDSFEIALPAAYLNLDLDLLARLEKTEKRYQSISKYPAIELDMSVLIARGVAWVDLCDFIKEKTEMLKKIDLVDVYRTSEWDNDDLHSLTLRLSYQSDIETLQLDQVNQWHEEIKASVVKHFKAVLR